VKVQVEQAQSGLESLSLSHKTINQLRENFISIEKYALILYIYIYIYIYILMTNACAFFLIFSMV